MLISGIDKYKHTISESCVCVCVFARIFCCRLHEICVRSFDRTDAAKISKRFSISVFLFLHSVVSFIRYSYSHLRQTLLLLLLLLVNALVSCWVRLFRHIVHVNIFDWMTYFNYTTRQTISSTKYCKITITHNQRRDRKNTHTHTHTYRIEHSRENVGEYQAMFVVSKLCCKLTNDR